ncbi:MAG TPA: fluoride efflux transporter CrcB [Bryobacteraceae bacterium]|nr:fluoride efflux transporter CrcB [Bryobacteraceae bacterium]
MKYLVVLAGGGVGSLARYVASAAIMQRFGGTFPLGTFVINITGSFLIGLLMTLLTDRLDWSPNWRLLLVVGFLGGYTTFSSFEWESLQALRQGARWSGLLNLVGSVVAGYIAVWLGALLADRG